MSRCLRSASRIAVLADATSSADGRERGAPFGDRPRLALFSQSGRRGLREALGECAPRGSCGDGALQVDALVVQRLDALVEFGQIDRRRRAWRPGVDRTNGESCAPLTLDPQRRRIERERKILQDGGVVAGRKIERDNARDAGAIGIDGDGIDRRGGVHVSRPRLCGGKCRQHHKAGRYKTFGNHSHRSLLQSSRRRAQPRPAGDAGRVKSHTTLGGETQRGRNRFDWGFRKAQQRRGRETESRNAQPQKSSTAMNAPCCRW